MKNYTVYASDGSFTISAKNYKEAIELGRRQCRHEGVRFEGVRISR